jgi:GNAT superfamily N-acetyltransferase
MIRPLTTSDLLYAAYLTAEDAEVLLGRLRWHLHSPYAGAWVVEHEGLLVGVACATRSATSARIGHFFIHPQHRLHQHGTALAQHLLAHLEANGLNTQTVQAQASELPFWLGQGFAPQGSYTRYHGGLHIDASRDEVVPLEPAHTLALLHLHHRATGEDHRALLLEHLYMAQAYVEQRRLRGALVPLLGHGLLVADAPAVGLELQRWLLPHQPDIIVPEENAAAAAHLVERKYTPSSAGLRLVRGPLLPYRPELVYAWPWGTP